MCYSAPVNLQVSCVLHKSCDIVPGTRKDEKTTKYIIDEILIQRQLFLITYFAVTQAAAGRRQAGKFGHATAPVILIRRERREKQNFKHKIQDDGSRDLTLLTYHYSSAIL